MRKVKITFITFDALLLLLFITCAILWILNGILNVFCCTTPTPAPTLTYTHLHSPTLTPCLHPCPCLCLPLHPCPRSCPRSCPRPLLYLHPPMPMSMPMPVQCSHPLHLRAVSPNLIVALNRSICGRYNILSNSHTDVHCNIDIVCCVWTENNENFTRLWRSWNGD